MEGLAAYASSDDDDIDIAERPAKITKLEQEGPSNVVSNNISIPHNSTHPLGTTHNTSTASEPTPSHITETAPGARLDEPTNEVSAESLHATERQRIHEMTFPTVPDFAIPPSPPPPEPNSDEAVQLAATTKKFAKFLELKKQGVHFNARLEDSVSLRNPSLLPNLMKFASISQQDSYASSLGDVLGPPTKWHEECYVDALIQRNQRLEAKRTATRDKLDFVPASATQTDTAAPTSQTSSR